MKKIAVVYSSKFGHAKRYADWLKEDIADVEVFNLSGFNPSQIMAYKLVIFVCGVYGDKLSVMDFFKKNPAAVAPQKIMIMAVSWYTNDSEDAKRKLIEENYTEQLKAASVPLYVVNSGIDKKALSAMDKMMLKAAQISIDKKDGRSSDDINALAIIKGYSDQTAKENLASIKKGIEEFFDPKAKAATAEKAKPAAVAASRPVSAQNTAPAAPAAPAKPKDVSEMKNGNDALSSLEDAFKALKAPKQPTAPAPAAAKPAAPAPAAEAAKPTPPTPAAETAKSAAPKPDPIKAAVASSVKDAIAALSNGTLPTNYAPAPAFELDETNADTYSEAVADSILLVNQAASAGEKAAAPEKKTAAPEPEKKTAAPAPEKKPAAAEPEKKTVTSEQPKNTQPVQPVQTAQPVQPAQPAQPAKSEAALNLEKLVRNAVPEPSVSAAPKSVSQAAESTETPAETAPEKPAEPPVRKNSYMELFAKRRRRTSEASSDTASEPAVQSAAEKPEPILQSAAEKPAPVVQKPEPAVRRTAEVSAPKAAEGINKTVGISDTNGIIDLDFIMDEEPAAVKTVEAPSANAFAADAIDMDGYDFIGEESARASSRALNAVQDLAKAKAKAEAEAENEKKNAAAERPITESENNILEKMKRDIETLAEESEQEIAAVETAAEEVQEDDPELDGFMFSNDVEYDLDAEFSEPVITDEEKAAKKSSQTDLDIKKLQEEINSSIEMNRAAKEKMDARYGKKPKEEPHNPFAVQFEEDEKGKKKKKDKTDEPRKRLEDPIDPDIFFSRQGKKELDMTPGSMPEIKFRNR